VSEEDFNGRANAAGCWTVGLWQSSPDESPHLCVSALDVPSPVSSLVKSNGEVLLVDNPANLPDISVVEEIREPVLKCFVMIPNENIGDIMQIMMEKRGTVENLSLPSPASSPARASAPCART